ncbi:zinc-dependent alcohol dehydrogenase [Mycolicibacterium diernhoferi]|uniref:Theronine dehydrogenase n=1 Tax=Mycolicibacterium diernhoferi TaxID=1801 RepID=A0A1Q4H791_9MYCO|nr:zinc-binding dehydrogenase [Mycolicibacterium diernhoferi]OJZ63420.1 theronine dehydrogenase [Mycolicibacterium diernhoferi]OPE54979.1 theronine dehydrogenase [Mycolicibacterium diernhoferi]PEG54000.1 theronine dehydrogenase [Mycolicibacterium diernhoferi]QYL20564.1 zinc-binding dehydrogenase [Mycolicibacterium diernhoferi]
MRAAIITAPQQVDIVDVQATSVGPADILVKIRACGICGSDTLYISIGGLPPRQGCMPIGHEPAGEVVEVGAEVRDIAVGDRVVVNPMAVADDIIGNGGSTGALAEYLLITNAVRGRSVEVIPDHVPYQVAALNEPMAVALHAVNQVAPRHGDQVLVFGAGPIGLGITIALKSRGVQHVVVADILPDRLEKALKVGADAVINSAEEDLAARLIDLHGEGDSMWPNRAGTDVFLDAAGVPAVLDTALGVAKRGAKLGIVAVHKEPISLDLMNVMSNELTIVGSMGYPNEIFEVTKDIVDNWEKYRVIISHTFDFDDLDEALRCVSTPGAADKVVITFD